MEINGLWEKLEPRESTLQTLKRDLSEGKVPELPFFIVDQTAAKNAIGTKLANIDGNRMLTNMIVGQYGNGKTNLLKYLQLFFQNNNELATVLYSRADVEQPDIILFLLRLLQDKFTDELISNINTIKLTDGLLPELANDFDDNFAAIKEYATKLFASTNTDEDTRKLIYLGTGRLYTINHWGQYELQQLQNFNRREILVLFLNILAKNNCYIIFAIDEIEKIHEKSKLRLNQFLTAYRELIDLSNKIKGHLLISCFTDAAGQSLLQSVNEAFYTRIKPDILELPPITQRDDLNTLLDYLNDLFGKPKGDIQPLVPVIEKKKHQRNRDLLRHCIELLLAGVEKGSLDDLLKGNGLTELYNEKLQELEMEGVLSLIHQRFFDPLQYYLEANYLLEDDNKLDKRNNVFVDEVNDRIQLFFFNENSDKDDVSKRVINQVAKYDKDAIIYAPVKLELSNSAIILENSDRKFDILDYEPKELFVLLMMFKDNFDRQEAIGKVIESYTNRYL